METIKSLIVEKIRKQSHGTLRPDDLDDENVRKELETLLRKVCYSLPGENDPDKNPEGAVFAAIMFNTHKDLHDAAVNKIVEMIMDDDLSAEEYKPLRQKIVVAVKRDWRELYGAVSYKDMAATEA